MANFLTESFLPDTGIAESLITADVSTRKISGIVETVPTHWITPPTIGHTMNDSTRSALPILN